MIRQYRILILCAAVVLMAVGGRSATTTTTQEPPTTTTTTPATTTIATTPATTTTATPTTTTTATTPVTTTTATNTATTTTATTTTTASTLATTTAKPTNTTTIPSTTPAASTTQNVTTPTTTVDICTLGYCKNGATCAVNGNDYNCTCVPGWTGKNCSEDVNDCVPMPCQNGGNCTDGGVNTYTCTCVSGWTGVNCTQDVDDCLPMPCKNGGNCTDGGVNTYTCTCVSGWTGVNCTEDVDDCLPMPCQNGGNCIDGGVNNYTCTCVSGWTGVNCTQDVNDCLPMPCQNGGNCTDGGVNTYTCTCVSGWTGVNCTQDVDDCGPMPCQNGGNCTDGGVNTYTCTCVSGWTGVNCTQDVDDCVPMPCQNGGNCIDGGVNTYTCTCVSGWTGVNCTQDVDDCVPVPCQNGGNCTDGGVNNYTCTCVSGWTGVNCTEDVDDCVPMPCKNGGNCTDGGVNTYTCTCVSGWTGVNCTEDVDDCQPGPCVNNGTCRDVGLNAYNCSCQPPYIGKNCSNVDHCYGDSPKCSNNGTCITGENNYTCTCEAGWTGWKCDSDVDDCLTNPCKNNGTCQDDGLNKYNCSCTPAWQGQTCETDFDECSSNPCVNGTCVNTPPPGSGTYTCTCNPDYEGTNCDKVIDDCKVSPCKNGGTCTDGINDYNCNCTEQWTGKSCTQDVDECSPDNPCRNGGYCQNEAGGFKCYCKTGWTGDTCDQDVDECSNSSACGEEPGWNCTNTDGSFTCKCLSTHVEHAHKCVEIIMLPDKSSAVLTGNDKIFGPFNVTGGIPYFGTLYYYVYVSTNGYIVLGRNYSASQPPNNESDWPEDQTILAPYWSDIDMGSNGRLLVSEYYRYRGNGAELDKMATIVKGDATFAPQYAIMVSWHDVSPYPATQYEGSQNSTFQLIIVTDGSRSHVIFTVVKYWTNIPDRNIVSGYSIPGKPPHFQALDSTSGQTQSRTSYKLYDTPNPVNSTNYECLSASSKTKDVLSYTETDDCPCLVVQAQLDDRYEFNETSNCAESKFWQDTVKTTCCFDQHGFLLTETRGAGWKVGQNDTVNNLVRLEYDSCCGGQSTLCSKFYMSHPSDSCQKYQSLQSVLLWGNPHKEVDSDMFYIFNGFGEYNMIDSQPIHVQGRTSKISDVNITTFTAFAILVGLIKFEIHLVSTDEIKFYLNGVQLQPGNSSADWKFDVSKNQYNLVFRSGVNIQVTGSHQLLLSITVPTAFGDVFSGKGLTDVYSETNVTKLLLEEETWRLKESTSSIFDYTLGNNIDFETLQHREFTPKYFTNLTQFLDVLFNSNQSVIQQAKSACDKNIACFVNYKLSDNTTMSAELKKKQTKQEGYVSERKNSSPPKFVNTEQTWSYDLDSVTSKVLNVSSDLVTSSDLDIAVESSQQNIGDYSIDPATNSFTWNVSKELRNLSSGSHSPLTFHVRDTKHNLTGRYSPNIVFCGCEKSSQCVYSLVERLAKMSQGVFYQAGCDCSGLATGRFCENPVDVCKLRCYPGSECNASTPDDPCVSCPENLKGDGVKCYDEDECLLGKAGCDQTCENTVGGFLCQCTSGYSIVNKTRCVDINECEKSTCPCMKSNKNNKFCVNTAGSCRCGCRSGFKGDNCGIAVSHVYGGRLVFGQVDGTAQVWTSGLMDKLSETFKSLARRVEAAIKSVFKTNSAFVSVTVIRFELTAASSSRRRKRSVGENIAATYELGFNDTVSDDVLNNTFKTGFESCNSGGKACVFGKNNNPIIAVSRTQSDVTDAYDLCSSDQNNDCHDASTVCRSQNGTYSCECRQGYKPWALQKHICEDVDECIENADTKLSAVDNLAKLCGKEGSGCVNIPGSYSCQCNQGYKWTGVTEKCKLMDFCEKKKPCKNGATCLNMDDTNGYICQCRFGWSGHDCGAEHMEAKKQKTIIIAVSASLGALAFVLLIIILFCWCRRDSDKDDGSRGEFLIATNDESNPEYQSSEFKRSAKIPRPSVRLHLEPENLEMERQPSYNKVTSFNQKTLSDYYDNPSFENDQNSHKADTFTSH